MKNIKAYENKEVLFFDKTEREKILKNGTPKEIGILFNELGKLLHHWDSDKQFFKELENQKDELYTQKEEAEKKITELLNKVGYVTSDNQNQEQYIHFAICGINMHQIPLYDSWNEDITEYLFNEDGSIKPFNDMLQAFYKAKGINPKKIQETTSNLLNDVEGDEKKAIKELLKNESETLQDITDIQKDDNNTIYLDFGYKSYRLMTEDQAQERAEEYIKSSVWAFNSDFLLNYMPDGMNEKSLKLIQEQCENANEPLLAMIKDIDSFIGDAISTDGRGHFLSSYDGEEHELKNNFVYIREN